MKRLLIVCSVCALLLTVFALPSLYGADRPEVPADGIKMDHFKADKNNKVTVFNHSTHTDYECEFCHHVEGDDQYASCAAAGCHNLMDKRSKAVESYYGVTHDRKSEKSCVGCHAEVAGSDKDKKKQLTSCVKSACHP
jgi:hypothetical protein